MDTYHSNHRPGANRSARKKSTSKRCQCNHFKLDSHGKRKKSKLAADCQFCLVI